MAILDAWKPLYHLLDCSTITLSQNTPARELTDLSANEEVKKIEA
jgi:hypothetical protein